MNHLTSNDRFVEGLNILQGHKPKKKQYMKLAEELAELSAAIMKHINKDDPEENILEEMVDVEVNLLLMFRQFPDEQVKEMCGNKITKFLKSKDLAKYRAKHEIKTTK